MDGPGELAQGLGHEPGLQPHVGVAHLPFQLRPGHQGCHAIYHHRVYRACAHQVLGYLQRLFRAVGLRYEELLQVDPAAPSVGRVKGMFCIYVGGSAPLLLSLGHYVESQRGLAGSLRPENLGDPASGNASNA